MPRITYEAWSPKGEALDMVQKANAVCADYRRQGYDLTLRQLFYQFVARGWIPNTVRSYKRLGDVVNRARLAGLLDWHYIVDRTRNLAAGVHWDSPDQIIRSAARGYSIDRWENQPVRVEVWVEKEALAGVVGRAAAGLDCAWFSCRGYVSQSEMWSAARRLLAYVQGGQRVVVLHLGDHDPSGIDMTRDISDRIDQFTTQDFLNADPGVLFADGSASIWEIKREMAERVGVDFPNERAIEVRRIALNMDQIEELNPPPNPAKLTDSRSTEYCARYGDESWELDALDPATLDELITEEIEALRDDDLWAEREAREEDEREVLTACSDRWDEVRAFLNGARP